MTVNFGYDFGVYPVFSSDGGIEGSFKRYSPFPQPKDVYDLVMRGLPKHYPLTQEEIPVSVAEDYLNSAITQIEMELGCNISEVVHTQVEDSIEGWMTHNAGGISLHRWPATAVTMLTIKFPHATTVNPVLALTYPPAWISLKRNKMNLSPGYGQITSTYDNTMYNGVGGSLLFAYGRPSGSYQPNQISVTYKAGFEHDKLPSGVADLIKTWAAYYMALDIWPLLFAAGSVSDQIDGVSQSATNIIPQYLQTRMQSMDKKRMDLAASFKKSFGRTFAFTKFGS
jgi:hypothetical protein